VAACGLAGVMGCVFYSYTVMYQPIISADHGFPFADPAAIFSYQHWPLTAKPFLSLFLSFSMEVKNPLSTSTEEM